MLVDGRECEEIVLSNGDKFYFITKYKGKEYRKVKSIQAKNIKFDQDQNIEIDLSEFVGSTIDLLEVFCVKSLHDDKEFKIDSDYLDDLEIVDYKIVEESVTVKMQEVLSEIGEDSKKKSMKR